MGLRVRASSPLLPLPLAFTLAAVLASGKFTGLLLSSACFAANCLCSCSASAAIAVVSLLEFSLFVHALQLQALFPPSTLSYV